ncbi:MAG: alpha-amylase family glycosyl hydrolase [Succinivibrio sp.]
MKRFTKSILPFAFTAVIGGCSNNIGTENLSSATPILEKFNAYNNRTGVVDKYADLRIYQIMVESFIDGDPKRGYKTGYGNSSHEGDLKGVIKAIPYIRSLNMNAIWITPIFESAKEDEEPTMLDATGYYTRNYFKIDRRFGDEETLKELVDTAHANGLYVFLDGVFGHFRSDLENTSPEGNHVTITQKCLGSNLTPYNPPENTSCANFDDDGSSIRYMTEVVRHYIKNYRIDGFRLDQAYQLPPDDLKKIRLAVEESSLEVTYKDASGKIVNPLAYVVGEIWSDNPTIARCGYGSKDQVILYSNFDFGSRYGVVQALATEEWEKQNHSGFRILEGLKYDELNLPNHAMPNMMISNHDLLRFGDLIQRAKLDDTYDERVKLALSYLALVQSGPITNYYGEEIGQEVKDFAKRKNVMGYYDDHVSRDNGKIDNFNTKETEMKNYFSYLMGLRAKHGALSNGSLATVKVNRDVFAVKKSFKGDSDFIIFFNLSPDTPQLATIDKELLKNGEYHSLLRQDSLKSENKDRMELLVPPLCVEIIADKSVEEFH